MLRQCRCMFQRCPPLDVSHYLALNNCLTQRQVSTAKTLCQRTSAVQRSKHVVDYSHVPVIREEDLEEKFVRGSGPGGSAVNKNSNCVVITHTPTACIGGYHERGIRPCLVSKRCFATTCCVRGKREVDLSRVPQIREEDLEEKFVRGSGPGGQAVNKNSNCVMLTHLPTGVVVKCHLSRSQDVNRRLAREMLATRLDNTLNGDLSVTAQVKAAQDRKSSEQGRRRHKLMDMKAKWREREGLDKDD